MRHTCIITATKEKNTTPKKTSATEKGGKEPESTTLDKVHCKDQTWTVQHEIEVVAVLQLTFMTLFAGKEEVPKKSHKRTTRANALAISADNDAKNADQNTSTVKRRSKRLNQTTICYVMPTRLYMLDLHANSYAQS